MEISEIKERLTMANVLHYYGLKTELQLREKIHNHPNWRDVGPSGFKTAERSLKNSDRSMAEFSEYFPKAIFKVYQVRTKKYIRYYGSKIY